MSKSLFDDAIADAKKLREVAEQNAKNAIIEAVTPKIRQFIEEQLVNESQDEKYSVSRDSISEDEEVLQSLVAGMTSDAGETVSLSEDTLSALVSMMSDSAAMRDTGLTESDIQDSVKRIIGTMTESDVKKLVQASKKLSEFNNNLDAGVISNHKGLSEEISEMSRNENNEVYYNIDLDDLLSEGDDHDDKDTKEMSNANSDLELEEILSALEEDDALNEAKLEIDLGDIEIDDDLRDALSRARLSLVEEEEEEGDEDLEMMDDVPEEEPMDDMPLDAPMGDEMPSDEPEDLDEVFEIDENVLRQELSRLRGSSQTNTSGNAGQIRRKLQNESRKNRVLNHKLAEYRSAVESLRGQLSEMNLFNAKLLYVNKLLQNKSITSAQKRTIVESLDRAGTIREVKLLYKSLSSSLAGDQSSGTISESVRRTVGSSSRTTRSASSVRSDVAEVNRWTQLAGIK